MIRIYLAGGLFTIAERRWNCALRDALVALGYSVFLPQESEANNRGGDNWVIAADDARELAASDVVVINLDGSMVDDGTALEAGLAVAQGKLTVGYRTDFRVCGEDPALRVNLMFWLLSHVVQYSSLENTSEKKLAVLIHQLIQTGSPPNPIWKAPPPSG